MLMKVLEAATDVKGKSMGLRTTFKRKIKNFLSQLGSNGNQSSPTEDWSPSSSHSAPRMENYTTAKTVQQDSSPEPAESSPPSPQKDRIESAPIAPPTTVDEATTQDPPLEVIENPAKSAASAHEEAETSNATPTSTQTSETTQQPDQADLQTTKETSSEAPPTQPETASEDAAEAKETSEPSAVQPETTSEDAEGAFAVYEITRLFPDKCDNCGAPSRGNWQYEDNGYSCMSCGEPYN